MTVDPSTGTATGADLRAACDALLGGTPVPPEQKPSIWLQYQMEEII